MSRAWEKIIDRSGVIAVISLPGFTPVNQTEFHHLNLKVQEGALLKRMLAVLSSSSSSLLPPTPMISPAPLV